MYRLLRHAMFNTRNLGVFTQSRRRIQTLEPYFWGETGKDLGYLGLTRLSLYDFASFGDERDSAVSADQVLRCGNDNGEFPEEAMRFLELAAE